MTTKAQEQLGDTGSPDLCKVLHIEKFSQPRHNFNLLKVKHLKCLAFSTNGS
jgi:hypothetical protein